MMPSEQFGLPFNRSVRTASPVSSTRTRGRKEKFLITVLAVGGLVDWFHLKYIGGVTVLALQTILYAFLVWFLWLAQDRRTRAIPSALRPFLFFLGWIVLTYLWFRPTEWGIQNFLVLFAFAGFVSLAENTLAQTPHPGWVVKTLVVATVLACVLYVIFMLLDGLGSNLVFHARTFATFVLIGMSWFLAGWRYGSKRDLLWASILVLLIALSLSRMALATAFLLFPLSWAGGLSWRKWMRVALVAILISATLYFAVSNFGPLRERFALDSDVSSLTQDEAADYTSGRFTYWVITLASWFESPWIGHGAGSSASLISSMYEVNSPLDEFLRVLHDYGIIGLVLFLYAAWKLLRTSWKIWAEAHRYRLPQARLHLGAFLAVVAVFFPMLTENSLVYLFMMVPLGIFLGASLGLKRAACA